MKRFLITSLIALFALSGCETISKQRDADESYSEFGVFIAGERIEKLHDKQLKGESVLDDPQFRNTLSILQSILNQSKLGSFDLQNETDRKALRNQLLAIYDGSRLQNATPDEFTGFCGFSTIQAYLVAIGFMDDEEQPIKVKGKIREWYYDNDSLTGHLSVNMRIDYFKRVGGQNKHTKRDLLHWDVVVKNANLRDPNTGYKVVNRLGPESIDNLDPFPGTIELPEIKRDPSNRDSIWRRGLDHKLFARGDSIVVKNVYRKTDDGPIKRLDDQHAFYKMTDCSCIDIMFRGHPPPLELPEQRAYCLGRCISPFVMNSE